jgi:hypothetical protein
MAFEGGPHPLVAQHMRRIRPRQASVHVRCVAVPELSGQAMTALPSPRRSPRRWAIDRPQAILDPRHPVSFCARRDAGRA